MHLCMEWADARSGASGRGGVGHSCCDCTRRRRRTAGVRSSAHRAAHRTRELLRMVWQASTVDWIGIGLLLIAVPALGSEAARQWIIAVAVVVYGYAAIGNAVATRGRHV